MCYNREKPEYFMKYYILGRYEPMEIALKRVGLRVVYAEKHGKKTVITITRYKARKKESNYE